MSVGVGPGREIQQADITRDFSSVEDCCSCECGQDKVRVESGEMRKNQFGEGLEWKII